MVVSLIILINFLIREKIYDHDFMNFGHNMAFSHGIVFSNAARGNFI